MTAHRYTAVFLRPAPYKATEKTYTSYSEMLVEAKQWVVAHGGMAVLDGVHSTDEGSEGAIVFDFQEPMKNEYAVLVDGPPGWIDHMRDASRQAKANPKRGRYSGKIHSPPAMAGPLGTEARRISRLSWTRGGPYRDEPQDQLGPGGRKFEKKRVSKAGRQLGKVLITEAIAIGNGVTMRRNGTKFKVGETALWVYAGREAGQKKDRLFVLKQREVHIVQIIPPSFAGDHQRYIVEDGEQDQIVHEHELHAAPTASLAWAAPRGFRM